MGASRQLTHLSRDGTLRMVDVTAKPPTYRTAVAKGEIVAMPKTIETVAEGLVPKGNVFEAARIAGVMAAKSTGNIIPLCHPLRITGIELSFKVDRDRIHAETRVSTTDRTGVEMEALVATSVALLTIYDMCKALDRGMVISNIRLMKKAGGRSGQYEREGEKGKGEKRPRGQRKMKNEK